MLKEKIEAAKAAVSDPCVFTEDQIRSLHQMLDDLHDGLQAQRTDTLAAAGVIVKSR